MIINDNQWRDWRLSTRHKYVALIALGGLNGHYGGEGGPQVPQQAPGWSWLPGFGFNPCKLQLQHSCSAHATTGSYA
jgi:hypothetical protein